jgi:hypothetical protein
VCNRVGSCAAGFTGYGNCTCLAPYVGVDCGSPVLATAMTPANGPTSGGTLIRLTGYFLGNSSSATVQFSTYLGTTCQNVLIHTDTQIVCYSPPGEPLYTNKSGTSSSLSRQMVVLLQTFADVMNRDGKCTIGSSR